MYDEIIRNLKYSFVKFGNFVHSAHLVFNPVIHVNNKENPLETWHLIINYIGVLSRREAGSIFE